MRRKFKKFTKLNAEEKKLFLEAYVTLGIVRMTLLTVSFKRLTRSLEHETKKRALSKPSKEQMHIAKKVGQSIMRASAHTPWESACLVQSLTAQKMLQKRGIAGAFYLGAMKDETSEGKMKAHAWSQCGEIILTGAKGHENFTVLSVFYW